MNTNSKKLGVLGVGFAAVLALAACGSSSKTSVTPGAQPSQTTATTTPTATGGAAPKPVVKTAMTAAHGSVLVDANGMTLYTLTNAGQAVACTGQCPTFWPPLLLPADTMTAVAADGVTGLGTASAAGRLQVTDNGLPLYRFSMDKTPGDTNGDGISSFGGVWHVVAAGPSPATGTTVPPATSPTTQYSYGGY
jgi:predicted lipoprotein with Yx(FWY)xxD motif